MFSFHKPKKENQNESLDHMERRKTDDAIQAVIRSNHLELNMDIPTPTTHGGQVPVVCVSISTVIPSLQSLCRDILCTKNTCLMTENSPTVDVCNLPNMDDLLKDLQPSMRSKIEACTSGKELQKWFGDRTDSEWDELSQEQARLTESVKRDYIESQMIELAKKEDKLDSLHNSFIDKLREQDSLIDKLREQDSLIDELLNEL